MPIAVLPDSNLNKSSIFPLKIHKNPHTQIWVSNYSSWKCECENDDYRTIQSCLFKNNKRIWKNISTFQKCYLALFTIRWHYKLWTELWCMEVGQRCEKKIVWWAEMSASQPAYVVKPTFYWLKVSSQLANKKLFKAFSQPIAISGWLINTVH